MQKDAEKILGIGGAAVLFYEAGKKCRYAVYQLFIGAVATFHAELGWGTLISKKVTKMSLS